ncbi:MAG: UvrD-helicase domain-containing protein [Paracoccus sp. (in: a-proteobacteria)]|uniref:ATP-dependent helicase n=1 Tax=Paracoccus sp. TaxID=267 RepID=UPI0026E0365C|nr:UvrD-helicase domain-containing protein [Paracoccus sp. (in: a-proteobacteria)]MDO5620133.1 UvrD-helicase domain-containing protein [Paracoccus sp. (in: a-proteobacteria)]
MSDFDDPFEAAEAETRIPLSQRALAARPAPYLEGLNPAQRAAVEALDGPVLLLAGAGTGKTRALTTRIAHILNQGRAWPSQILAVTFTNKAAREMRDRIGRLLGEAVEGMPWLGTFHSISVKILRRHAELVGDGEITLKPSFTILDTDDQIRLLKQLIAADGLDEKRWPARALAGLIDGWKNRALIPDRVPKSDQAAFEGHGVRLYRAYQRRLLELNAVDFGDLLLHCVTLFQAHPDLLAKWQDRFRYILVDEYQDTNVAQYMWLRLLAARDRNICCVGDDDQSIYGWRGAEVGNILRFETDFPGAQVIRLEQNYRSTPQILAAASGLIAANQGRLGKTLWTEAEAGAPVRLIGHWDSEAEARWIGEEIEAFHGGHRASMGQNDLNDMAILVRASHQMRAFEDRFMSIGLPYRVIGGPRFYERAEIRDAMAYFRLAVSPADDLAFERIINTPRRGLGDKAVQTIQSLARRAGEPLLIGAQRAVAEKAVSGKALSGLTNFVQAMGRWHADALDGAVNHIELAERILDESGYTAMWQNDKSPDAPGRLDNLKELVKALEDFDNLQGFLEHVALVMDRDSGDAVDQVSIMTLHAAKGLEYPIVFLPGWEDGLFPNQRALDETGTKGLEEERRLAYVGITRAEKLCTISFAGNRRMYGQWQSQLPSRFIDELPGDEIEVLTPPGLYGGGFGAAAMAGAATMQDRAARADVYNSPGWRRLQDRQQTSPRRPVVIEAKAAASFAVGDRVSHARFGDGTILGVVEDTLTVQFGDMVKNVKAGYVQPANAPDDVPF